MSSHDRPQISLNADEKRLFTRMAEVYAGFLAHTDHHIGRLLDYLEESGQRENTVVVVVSDNGASGDGGPNGSVNEMKFANGIADNLAENMAKIDDLGGPKTYNHYANGWAMAFNTPFKMWKRYEFNGGTCDPCIISWPAGTKARGEIREQYHHAVDIVPTILDFLGVDAPETIKGHVQSRFDGVSMHRSVDDPSGPSARKTQFYAMLGSRSIWHEGWKAVTTHPTLAGWGHFNEDQWELYHTDVDRAELNDLAAQHPDGWELFMRARRDGRRAALIDLQQIGFLEPADVDDLDDHRLKARNLAAMWTTMRTDGAECLVVVGRVDDGDQLRMYTDALPAVTLTLVRLHASRDQLTDRIVRREQGNGPRIPGDHLCRRDTAELARLADHSATNAARLAKADMADVVVNTDGLKVDEVTGAIRREIGNWPNT